MSVIDLPWSFGMPDFRAKLLSYFSYLVTQTGSNQFECFSQTFLDHTGRHETAQFCQKRGLTLGSVAHLPGAQRRIDNRGGYAPWLGRLLNIILDSLGDHAELFAVIRNFAGGLRSILIHVGFGKRRLDKCYTNSELTNFVIQGLGQSFDGMLGC